MTFPGGILVGCDAGLMVFTKIKGTHTAMKSGIVASENVFRKLEQNLEGVELEEFQSEFNNSWAGRELKAARNVRPAFKYGLKLGTILTGIDQIFLRGKAPWTLKHGEPDHCSLKEKTKAKKIEYQE